MPALDPEAAERLAKLLGMLGSDHNGEAVAAARKVHRLIASRGLTWRQVLAHLLAAGPTPATVDGHAFCSAGSTARWALSHPASLTERELTFLRDIVGRGSGLSHKQTAWLRRIVARIRRELTGGRTDGVR